MTARPFMAGVAADVHSLSDVDRQYMLEAGVGWLRSEIRAFDQERFFAGKPQTEKFHLVREKIAQLRKDGFQIMGLTPTPKDISPAAGKPGSQEYFDNYRRLNTCLGREFEGLIEYWQIANEVDIWIFRAALTLEESVEFLRAGLRGMKDAGKHLKVGINITLFPSKPGEVDGNTDRHEGVFIAKGIYHDPSLEVDYVGFDSYPGTWREGGVESWSDYLDAFHELTRKPIIVQEFGYASEGELMSDVEKKGPAYPCEIKKWRFGWGGGHTPEVQAEFITETYKIFAQKPFVIGATYFSWKDATRCWQCGDANCPAETAWGLVDREGNLKPSYHSLKSSLQTHFLGR